jgi:hypothetical protein
VCGRSAVASCGRSYTKLEVTYVISPHGMQEPSTIIGSWQSGATSIDEDANPSKRPQVHCSSTSRCQLASIASVLNAAALLCRMHCRGRVLCTARRLHWLQALPCENQNAILKHRIADVPHTSSSQRSSSSRVVISDASGQPRKPVLPDTPPLSIARSLGCETQSITMQIRVCAALGHRCP